MIMQCLNCGKELVKGQLKYCSISCRNEYQTSKKIQSWKDGTFNGVIGKYGLSKTVRKYILEKANYQCELCGWNKVNPYTNKLPLEIHHIDGNHENNSENNLQVLCPNCHSLTSNFKSRGGHTREVRREYDMTNTCIDCGKTIANTSIRCRECEGKHRRQIAIENLPISREELKQRIRNEPFESIGRSFNVAGNTIKKWCDKYNLPRLKKEINNISDKDWEDI